VHGGCRCDITERYLARVSYLLGYWWLAVDSTTDFLIHVYYDGLTLPYLTLPAGRIPALYRQTLNAEAILGRLSN